MSADYTGSENLEVMLEADRYNSFLRALVRLHAGEAVTVLDFGAGIGTFTSAVNVPPDRVSCVEPDDKARALLRASGYHVYADIEEISDQFDYIFSLNVLEHIEDDAQAAAQLLKRLKPGGTLFIYVPAFNHLRSSMDDLVGHHRRYTRRSLGALLTTSGFETNKLVYTDFLGYFATLFFKLLESFKGEPDGKINRPLLLIYDRVIFPVSRLLSVPFSRFLGKNVYAVARRPPSQN